MSNFGPHLRHNRHHTLFIAQEQPCSQSDLHLHDQQSTSKYFSKDWLYYYLFISLYYLTTHLFIGFTIGKTLNTWHQKMVTHPCKSLDTNPKNVEILLQSTPSRITSRPSFNLHSISTHPPVDLMLVELFEIFSMPLPCLNPSTFNFKFTWSIHLNL
jgi:hypothetical protein